MPGSNKRPGAVPQFGSEAALGLNIRGIYRGDPCSNGSDLSDISGGQACGCSVAGVPRDQLHCGLTHEVIDDDGVASFAQSHTWHPLIVSEHRGSITT